MDKIPTYIDPKTGKVYYALETAAEADALSEAIEDIYDGWYSQTGRVYWDDFYDRLADWTGWELQEDDSPADRRVRAIVREIKAAG